MICDPTKEREKQRRVYACLCGTANPGTGLLTLNQAYERTRILTQRTQRTQSGGKMIFWFCLFRTFASLAPFA
jgi:hypothetical protein